MSEGTVPDYAWGEYELLQGKIDKIGGFRFLVRGWAITLVAGLVVTKMGLLATLAGVLLVAVFHTIEGNQNRWQKVFGRRLLSLERALRRNDKLGAPRIAGVVVAAQRKGSRRPIAELVEARVFYGIMYLILTVAATASIWGHYSEATVEIAKQRTLTPGVEVVRGNNQGSHPTSNQHIPTVPDRSDTSGIPTGEANR